ncbi:Mur ligase family protein [Alphaproteobacteria bacterium]|nr:Mur ligase family protein [Alphaproteobacteria bacterium]
MKDILAKKIVYYLLNSGGKAKISSLEIIKGDVFLSLLGSKTHGNQYIPEAIKNGAKYIITDKKLEDNFTSNKILVVEDILMFLLSIAKVKRNRFTGKVIGITGSVGKTTLKENLKYFISQTSTVSASFKSYNNYLGILISLINLNLSSSFAIFEIGTNNFEEIKHLTSIIMPSQAIITNILPTHLENFKTTRNIAIEKSDIFNPKYNPNIELLILSQNNIDEAYIVDLALKKNIPNIITFGKMNKQDYQIEKIRKINEENFEVSICNNNITYKFKINKNQLSRVNNILISLIIFVYNKLDISTFIFSTKKVKLIEGRGLEKKIYINNKIINFIDETYNASPATMKMCVDYFKNIKIMKNQKKILILGDMQELGDKALGFHIELLEYIITLNLNNVIICGKFMKSALNKLTKKDFKIKLMLDEKLILKYLEDSLNNGDILSIKGSNSSLTNKIGTTLLQKGEN